MRLSVSRILALLALSAVITPGTTIAQQNAPPPPPQQPGMSAPGMTPPAQPKKKHHCNKQKGTCPKKHKQQGQPNSMMPQQTMPQPVPTHL